MSNVSKAYSFQLIVVIVSLLGLHDSASPQEPDNRAIYLLANGIADDIELIREVMGRPYDDSPRLPASEVGPLELFLQSATLFRKANQLAQQFGVAEREAPPAAPEGVVKPSDIHAVIQAAQRQIGIVKDLLEIEQELVPLRRETSISDTGIFNTIIDMNRQLNLLLDAPIQWSDVYDQLALSNNYGAGVLTALGAPNISELSLPTAAEHMRPTDVYRKLLDCIEAVGRIASEVSGVRVMSLSSRRNIPDDIAPGHVYDVATILVADMAELAAALSAEGIRLAIERPERIFPTQAYQRAMFLEQQLAAIEAQL